MGRVAKYKQFVPVWLICFACLVLLGVGCSSGSSGSINLLGGTATVTTLLTFDSEGAAMAAAAVEPTLLASPVPVGDIESLTVTITEVALDYTGTDNNDDFDEDAKIVVFAGAMDVDILDLTDVSEVVSSATLPAGVYDKIRLSISNPRLVLKSNPQTVITDVHLTASGRLFISGEFALPEGSYLLILNFIDLHLVEQGNGGYTLTPQLQADVEIQPVEALLAGTIISLDKTADTFVVALTGGSTIEVNYAEALIFVPGDINTPTGTEDDLEKDLEVAVAGTLWVDGVLTADYVEILSIQL